MTGGGFFMRRAAEKGHAMRYAMTMIAAAVLLTGTASARDLPVPANKGWQHAETGLILTATLDGLPRTRLTDATTSERDVVAEFADRDQADVITVYLFHPAVDSVAMWFDRSEAALMARDTYRGVTPSTPAPVAFAAPGGSARSALRRSYLPRSGRYHGTALAMIPLGEFLVAIRMSSMTLEPAQLDARLSRVIAAIRWPDTMPPAPMATAIADCTTALRFTDARMVKPEGSDMLMTLLGGAMSAQHKDDAPAAAPTSWCRDATRAPTYGVYRADTAGNGYTIAIQDAGRTIAVYPSLAAQLGEKGGAYSVSLRDVDGSTTAFPSFDRLPSPQQVTQTVFRGNGLGKQVTGKDGQSTVTIDAKSLK